MPVVCKSGAELEKMRRSGQIVRQVLEATRAVVAPGVSTMDLERVAEKKILESGAVSAFKGYHDYPRVLCTSINNEIVFTRTLPVAQLGPGDLSGNYAGAQGSASIGVGAGGNVLVGGSANSISLQPLSLQGQVGLNVAAGLESLELRPGR